MRPRRDLTPADTHIIRFTDLVQRLSGVALSPMALTFLTRHVGEVTVVTCSGRIVEGEERTALERHLDGLMLVNPTILLHLGEVSFVDSAGLGMLVRYMTRAQNASGALRICAVSPAIDRVLAVSRLKPVLQPFDSEGAAILDAHKS